VRLDVPGVGARASEPLGRERQRESDIHLCMHTYIYAYIHM
jgi:hypothetical protein